VNEFAAPNVGEVAADATGATIVEATSREITPIVFNNFIVSAFEFILLLSLTVTQADY
jgi:hypothetical protein